MSLYRWGIGAEVDACKQEAEAFEVGAISPAKAKAELDDVHGEYSRFDADVKYSKASDKFKATWNSFSNEFEKFYHDSAEGIVAWFERFMTSGSYKKAKEYRCRLRAWREALVKEDPSVKPSEPARVTTESSGIESTAKWVAIGAAGVLLVNLFRK